MILVAEQSPLHSSVDVPIPTDIDKHSLKFVLCLYYNGIEKYLSVPYLDSGSRLYTLCENNPAYFVCFHVSVIRAI